MNSVKCGMKSTAAIANHPLHPVFIVFPVAFFLGALVSDLAYWASRNACWPMMTFWLLSFGLIGSVVSAVTGLIDFLTIPSVRGYTIGWTHAIGNVLAVVAATANWVLRLRLDVPAVPVSGYILSAVTAAILLFTGWWGGELSYRYGIGVDLKT